MCLNEKEQAYQEMEAKAIKVLFGSESKKIGTAKIDCLIRRFIVLAQKQEFGNNRDTSHFSGSVDDEVKSLYKRILDESLSYSDTTKRDMFNVKLFINWHLKAEKMVESLLNETNDSIDCEIASVSVLDAIESYI